MLVVKTLHIWMVISWFAGLFYLPRIFVNLAMVPADSKAERDRLLLMAGKLYKFMTPLGVLSVFGYGSAMALVAAGCTPRPRWSRYWPSITGIAAGYSSSSRMRTTTRPTSGTVFTMNCRS